MATEKNSELEVENQNFMQVNKDLLSEYTNIKTSYEDLQLKSKADGIEITEQSSQIKGLKKEILRFYQNKAGNVNDTRDLED